MSGADVRRYHTVRTLTEDTVGHHSHGVAMLVLLLDPDADGMMLRAALLHDLSEQYTGDIPSPAKREFGIGEDVSSLELKLLDDAGLPMPYLKPEEWRTLKLADIAHGALFCLRELQMGNRLMAPVYERYIGYAEGMVLSGRERELFDTIKTMKEAL